MMGAQGTKAKNLKPKLTKYEFSVVNLVMSTENQISHPAYKFYYIHGCYLFIGSVTNLVLVKDPSDEKVQVHWMTINNEVVYFIDT